MKKTFFGIISVLLLFFMQVCVYAEPNVVFEMADCEGDDKGPGSYVYPTNIAFEPGSGRFDLVSFKVSEDDSCVYFDMGFRDLRNTWDAYEGFSDQIIDIYIDNRPGGEVNTLHRGANVQFDPNSAWDVNIRVAPYRQSYFHTLHKVETPEKADALIVERVPNTNVIRASVDKKLIGSPDSTWKYYVLVGSYDSYGDDCYRPIDKEASSWVFGGGEGSDYEPRIIDVLDNGSGENSQYNQLRSYSDSEKKFATLKPVSAQSGGKGFLGKILILAGILAFLPFVVFKGVKYIKKRKTKNSADMYLL